MPIRPEHRWLYPIDWPQLSAVIRFERAKGRCEHCVRPHGQLVCHLGDGRWWDQERLAWRDGNGRLVRAPLPSPAGVTRTTRVYLATAHLDHNPGNSHPRNLAALCQRCHLRHDRPEHRRRRWITMRTRKALGDLFLGPYLFLLKHLPPAKTELALSNDSFSLWPSLPNFKARMSVSLYSMGRSGAT